MNSMKKIAVSLVLLCSMLRPAFAASDDYLEEAGWGMLAALANVAYMPAKLTYAAVGAALGGIAYIVAGADLDAADGIWTPTLGGTYVLTSSMLRGETPVEFAGPGSGAHRGSGVAAATEPVEDEPLPVLPKRVKP